MDGGGQCKLISANVGAFELYTMNPNNNRRNFIKAAGIGTLAALSLPQIVEAAFEKESIGKVVLKKGSVILFQGDSVTDWWRNHHSKLPNTVNALGAG